MKSETTLILTSFDILLAAFRTTSDWNMNTITPLSVHRIGILDTFDGWKSPVSIPVGIPDRVTFKSPIDFALIPIAVDVKSETIQTLKILWKLGRRPYIFNQ